MFRKNKFLIHIANTASEFHYAIFGSCECHYFLPLDPGAGVHCRTSRIRSRNRSRSSTRYAIRPDGPSNHIGPLPSVPVPVPDPASLHLIRSIARLDLEHPRYAAASCSLMNPSGNTVLDDTNVVAKVRLGCLILVLILVFIILISAGVVY